MKRKIVAIVIALVLIVAAVCAFSLMGDEATYIKDVDSQKLEEAYRLLNTSYLNEGEEAEIYYTDFIKQDMEAGQGEYEAVLSNGISAKQYYKENKNNQSVAEQLKNYGGQIKEVDYRDVATYRVNVLKAGLYYLNLDYISVGESLSDYTVSTAINGEQQYTEMNTIALPIIWEDTEKEEFIGSEDKKEFPLDSYGDEMAPSQNRVQEWTNTYIYNNTYVSSTPLVFYLEKGENTIEIENVSSGGLALGNLKVEAAIDKEVSYEEYAAAHSDAELVKDSENALVIDAVYYSKKNSTDATYGTEAKDSLTRFNIDYEKLNTLSWSGAGIEVTYTFRVKKTGNYHLSFHYSNGKKEFQSFETIKIDGEVPFKEMYNYAFDPVSSGYENVTLADKDGNNYNFYLTEGVHTISIKQENEPVMEAYTYALILQEHITDFELEITKIVGSDVDTERNWKMTKYIPNIEKYLEAYETIIQHIRFLLQDYSPNGNEGAVLAYLDQAQEYIDTMKEYPDDIALHTEELTGADNSILVALSNFTTEVTSNDFTLDRIYITGDKGQIEKAFSLDIHSDFGKYIYI